MDFPESATAGVGKRVRDTTMRASAPEDADIAVQTMRNVYVQVRQLAARDLACHALVVHADTNVEDERREGKHRHTTSLGAGLPQEVSHSHFLPRKDMRRGGALSLPPMYAAVYTKLTFLAKSNPPR
ncbi:hypothetical protein VTO73DRAFT_11360 [Trametes versicolor]